MPSGHRCARVDDDCDEAVAQRPARRGERSSAGHGRLRVRRHVELIGQGDVPEVVYVTDATPRAEEVQQEALLEVRERRVDRACRVVVVAVLTAPSTELWTGAIAPGMGRMTSTLN